MNAIIDEARCVRLRIYVDKHPEVCRAYRVPNPELRDEEGFAPYPSLQLWTPSGVLVARSDGERPPEPFGAWLTAALAEWPQVAAREEALQAEAAEQPDKPGHRSALARFYEGRQTFAPAARLWVELSRRESLSLGARRTAAVRAGHAYLMHAAYAEAREVLELAAAEGATSRPQALYLLGFAAQQQLEREEAARLFQQVIDEAPESKWAARARQGLGQEPREEAPEPEKPQDGDSDAPAQGKAFF